MEHLIAIQSELKAPKGKFNSFGKYYYRSCEDILEAAKPICHAHKSVLTLSDRPIQVGDRYYIEATAKLKTPNTEFVVTAYAREDSEKKGMDGSQITGTASSYARKYALNGLFNIDDTKDADTDEFQEQIKAKSEPKKTSKAKSGSKPNKPAGFSKVELVELVVSMCDQKRYRVAELCERTGVEKLEDMTEEQLSRWVDWLETR